MAPGPGRPAHIPELTDEIADEILREIASNGGWTGKALIAFGRHPYDAQFDEKLNDPGFLQKYARAKEIGRESAAWEEREIADAPLPKKQIGYELKRREQQIQVRQFRATQGVIKKQKNGEAAEARKPYQPLGYVTDAPTSE